MNKRRFVAISIGLLGISGILSGCAQSGEDVKVENLKQVYDYVLEKDIRGEEITSDELSKTIEKNLKDEVSNVVGEIEGQGDAQGNSMVSYVFENETEILDVSYSKDENNKEDNIEYISYQLKSEEEPYTSIGYVNIKDDYALTTVLYPENMNEQKEYFDIIQSNQEVLDIYDMYYKLVPYVEQNKSVSVEEMSNILGQSMEDIEQDMNDEIATSYVLEKDNYRFTILYDKKEQRPYFTSVENSNEMDVVNVYCGDKNSSKESNMIVVNNKDLDKQEMIFKEIIKK